MSENLFPLTGGPAFPTEVAENMHHTGMTLLDFFAAHALPMISSNPVPDWQVKIWCGDSGGLTREEIAARAAYEYAAAMLRARVLLAKKQEAQ